MGRRQNIMGMRWCSLWSWPETRKIPTSWKSELPTTNKVHGIAPGNREKKGVENTDHQPMKVSAWGRQQGQPKKKEKNVLFYQGHFLNHALSSSWVRLPVGIIPLTYEVRWSPDVSLWSNKGTWPSQPWHPTGARPQQFHPSHTYKPRVSPFRSLRATHEAKRKMWTRKKDYVPMDWKLAHFSWTLNYDTRGHIGIIPVSLFHLSQ